MQRDALPGTRSRDRSARRLRHILAMSSSSLRNDSSSPRRVDTADSSRWCLVLSRLIASNVDVFTCTSPPHDPLTPGLYVDYELVVNLTL